MRAKLAVVVTVLAMAYIVAAAQQNPFVGRWNLTGTGYDNHLIYFLEVKQVGDHLERRARAHELLRLCDFNRRPAGSAGDDIHHTECEQDDQDESEQISHRTYCFRKPRASAASDCSSCA